MAKRGAPRTKSPDVVSAEMLKRIDELAEAQCKDTLIAETLGFDVGVFKRQFAKRCRQKRAEGKGIVMRKQYEGCKARGKGATTERIWFGKQHLEQTDKQDHNVAGEVRLLPPVVTILSPKPQE
jgi:hypothetical protein